MNTLYILGGPPRTAKTTIMHKLLTEAKVPVVAGDAVEHAWRNMLTGDAHQMLGQIEFSGTAISKTSIAETGQSVTFSGVGTESELTLRAIEGLLEYYDRSNTSVAIEAGGFTPGWASGLKLSNLKIRTAFVGYTDPSHADAIIAHAKSSPHDWINEWLVQEQGDESKIRVWAAKQADKCRQLKMDAESHGYPFFDISRYSFEEYISAVLNYFFER